MHNHHPHPKFSIITVTYNAAKVLEDTIQSIVTQTYKNLAHGSGKTVIAGYRVGYRRYGQ